jgi:hypothetical protein
LISI